MVTPDSNMAQDRILTAPNAITLVRLACLPIYLWLLVGQDNPATAAALLAVLGATDWVDGYVARRFHQVSELGTVLDPVADRLLFFVGIGAMLWVGAAPVVFSVVVLIREVLVAGATIVLALMGAQRIPVSWFGKAGTFGLMFAFPLFLAGASDLEIAPVFRALGWVAGIPGLALSLYAACAYVPAAGAALREGRAARNPTG